MRVKKPPVLVLHRRKRRGDTWQMVLLEGSQGSSHSSLLRELLEVRDDLLPASLWDIDPSRGQDRPKETDWLAPLLAGRIHSLLLGVKQMAHLGLAGFIRPELLPIRNPLDMLGCPGARRHWCRARH